MKPEMKSFLIQIQVNLGNIFFTIDRSLKDRVYSLELNTQMEKFRYQYVKDGARVGVESL